MQTATREHGAIERGSRPVANNPDRCGSFLTASYTLTREFQRELIAFEEQAKMPYITSIERIGRQEGWREGRQEGEAAMLLRLITLKFGPPSEAVTQRIQDTDPDTLLQWSERILTAQTLDDVLR